MKRMFKKAIAIALATVMLSTTVMAASVKVSDIQGHWAEGQISKWIDQDLVGGYEDNTFRPNKQVTRAELITFVNRVAGYTKQETISFEDVQENAWYAQEVGKALEAGILVNQSGAFKANEIVTREEAATVLAKAFAIESDDATVLDTYQDKEDVSQWAKNSVAALIEQGYIAGREEGVFAPKGNLTRAELVVMIDNVMGTLIKTTDTHTGDKKGNVVVQAPGTILEDMVIEGNLYIAASVGEGEVTLKNVEVKGKTIVAGGGENSIIIIDSIFGENFIVNKENGKVRILATGTTSIPYVTILSGAKLESDLALANRFGQVIIDTGSDDAEVILDGAFEKVIVQAPNTNIKLEGKVDQFEVTKEAQGSKVAVAEKAEIKTLVVKSESKFEGTGKIINATIEGKDVKFDKNPETATVMAGGSATSDGKELAEGTHKEPGKSTGGGSSGGGGNPSSGSDDSSDNSDDDKKPVEKPSKYVFKEGFPKVETLTTNNTEIGVLFGQFDYEGRLYYIIKEKGSLAPTSSKELIKASKNNHYFIPEYDRLNYQFKDLKEDQEYVIYSVITNKDATELGQITTLQAKTLKVDDLTQEQKEEKVANVAREALWSMKRQLTTNEENGQGFLIKEDVTGIPLLQVEEFGMQVEYRIEPVRNMQPASVYVKENIIRWDMDKITNRGSFDVSIYVNDNWKGNVEFALINPDYVTPVGFPEGYPSFDNNGSYDTKISISLGKFDYVARVLGYIVPKGTPAPTEDMILKGYYTNQNVSPDYNSRMEFSKLDADKAYDIYLLIVNSENTPMHKVTKVDARTYKEEALNERQQKSKLIDIARESLWEQVNKTGDWENRYDGFVINNNTEEIAIKSHNYKGHTAQYSVENYDEKETREITDYIAIADNKIVIDRTNLTSAIKFKLMTKIEGENNYRNWSTCIIKPLLSAEEVEERLNIEEAIVKEKIQNMFMEKDAKGNYIAWSNGRILYLNKVENDFESSITYDTAHLPQEITVKTNSWNEELIAPAGFEAITSIKATLELQGEKREIEVPVRFLAYENMEKTAEDAYNQFIASISIGSVTTPGAINIDLSGHTGQGEIIIEIGGKYIENDLAFQVSLESISGIKEGITTETSKIIIDPQIVTDGVIDIGIYFSGENYSRYRGAQMYIKR